MTCLFASSRSWSSPIRFAALMAVSLVGCHAIIDLDDFEKETDEQDGSGAAGSTAFSSAFSSSSLLSSSSSGQGGNESCQQACAELYDCLSDDNFAQCPGLSGITVEEYIEGCMPNCEMSSGAFPAVVDPSDCPGTIELLGMIDPTFNDTCGN